MANMGPPQGMYGQQYQPSTLTYSQPPAPYYDPGVCPPLCPHLSQPWREIAAHHVASHPTKTQVLDCGASITTVGMHTSLQGMFPVPLLLRTTQGCTPRVFQGTCRLVFLDIHAHEVNISLPAVTSPDIQPDIVLLSYHQLLKAGYKIMLHIDYGEIYTPTGQLIRLHVCDGLWHFPVPPDHPKHQLYVDTSTAHMVLKGWRHIPRVPSLMQAAAQPPPAGMELHAPSSVSCIDQEPYLQLNENASTFAAPQPQLVDIPRPDLTMTLPALHFDSTIHDPQIFVPSEEPGHVHQQEPATTSTSNDSSCAVSDQNYLHTLQGTESAS
jgi:hypothetical protein